MTDLIMDIESYPSHFAFATGDVQFLKDDTGSRRYYPIDLLPVPDTSKTTDFEAEMLRKISSALGISNDQLKSNYIVCSSFDLKLERKKGRAYRLLRYGNCRRQWKRANRLLAEACPSLVERRWIANEASRFRLRDRMGSWTTVLYDNFMKMEIRDGD